MRSCLLTFTPPLLLLVSVQQSQGHGTMMEPVPRQPESLYWYQVGCMIGCTCSGGGKETYPSLASVNCESPATPMLTKASELTWNPKGTSPMGDWNKYMPWRAPGTSKPLDACGIASGFEPTAGVQYPHNFADASIKQGMKGTDLPVGPVTVWAAGATVQASYRLIVNHGGGYQYRVCPKTESPTEACFQANPVAFANAKTTVVYNTGARITLNAVDVTTGVQPAGHAWRRLPIPACNCDLGSGCQNTTLSVAKKGDLVAYTTGVKSHGHCTLGLQFDAPHLHDGTWTEGFGYYIDKLGETTGGTRTDMCTSYGEESDCSKTSGCAWHEGKGCYSDTVKSGAKKADPVEDTCTKLKDQEGCESATESGCEWYAAKNQCWMSKGGRRLQFSGVGAKDDGVHQWWVTDELKAPSKVGDYILQWRWDNEQTPQIWTTCADIRVGDGSPAASAASMGRRVRGAIIGFQLVLAAALLKL